MGQYNSARAPLSFRKVNQLGRPGYVPEMQRHHLLPLQLLSRRSFRRLFEELGAEQISFDDFRRNGLLLPASEAAAERIGMPLHRGPHRAYNSMVIERVGQIESDWARMLPQSLKNARLQAAMRISLLQKALMRRFLTTGLKPLQLNRFDRLGSRLDFSDLDEMAEMLWDATETFAMAA